MGEGAFPPSPRHFLGQGQFLGHDTDGLFHNSRDRPLFAAFCPASSQETLRPKDALKNGCFLSPSSSAVMPGGRYDEVTDASFSVH